MHAHRLIAFALVVAGCKSSSSGAPDGSTPPIDAFAPDSGSAAPLCAPMPTYVVPSNQTTGDVLSTLNPDHPRLEMMKSQLDALRAKVATDPVEQQLYATLVASWKSALEDTNHPIPLPVHGTNNTTGPVRDMMVRVTDLVGLYELSPDHQDPTMVEFRERVIADIETVIDPVKFPNWNHCDQMLTTAEMAFAVAIVYDWLYDELPDADRAAIVTAMVNNALTPAANDLAGHSDKSCNGNTTSWTTFVGNQSLVDTGGLVAGALAIAGDPSTDPNAYLIRAVINGSVPVAQIGEQAYAPDGGWHEGLGYWDYGSHYLAHLVTGAQTALGTDLGLSAAQGLANTGEFRIQMDGPIGENFDFADGGTVVAGGNQPAFWLARQLDDPRDEIDAVLRAQHPATNTDSTTAMHGPYDTQNNLDVFDIIRYDPGCAAASAPDLPLGEVFRGAEVVAMRTSWTDRNAIYLALKAGDSTQTHVHFDQGQYVFDLSGQRWAIDLGNDSYSLPNYFTKPPHGGQTCSKDVPCRADYYHTRTEGHNTLSISTTAPQQELYFANQDIDAATQLVAFQTTPDLSFAVADLTAAYTARATGVSGGLTSVQRGAAIVGGQQVLIDDELTSPVAAEVIWNLHVRATPTLNSDGSVTLEQNGTQIEMRVVDAPTGAAFTVSSADPTPRNAPGNSSVKENTNGWKDGACKSANGQPACVYNVYLRVSLPAGTPSRIAVRFAPRDNPPPLPTLVPLATWITASPIQR